MPDPPASPLDAPLTSRRGVGPERAAQLARLKLFTVGDLLFHRPRRYEDRRHIRAIGELSLGQTANARGRIVAQGIKRWRRGGKSVFEFILEDGTGRLHCRWWNLPFMERYFQRGDEVFVHGKLGPSKPRTMDHPETEIVESGEENFIHINRIVPIYPLTEGLPQRWLRGLVWRTLGEYEAGIGDPWQELLCGRPPVAGPGAQAGQPSPRAAASVSPAMKPAVPSVGTGVAKDNPSANPGAMSGRQDAALDGRRCTRRQAADACAPRADAIHMLHFPEEMRDVEVARERLALEEFLELQLEIQRRRKKLQATAKGPPCAGDNHLIGPFLKQLGFGLTGAQTKVLREIRRDLGGAQPMRRLLQGDVGAGKTVVAACAALMVIESGFNVALMAPTEILAEQHFQSFNRWFGPLGIQVDLRTGSRKTVNLEPRTSHLPPPTSHLRPPTSDIQRNGSIDSTTGDPQRPTRKPRPATLTVGTHALIESGFVPDNLGLVIIDEQHKFGVAQREQLVRKGRYPHLLVMTATPIPRTLGLTLYGDLDISVIDRLPEGRGRIKTFVRPGDKLPKVFEFIRAKLREGRQAYVVYPRVEEADGNELKAVTREWEKLQTEFAPYQVALLHGRLKTEVKEGVMADFRAGRVHLLVATSVIEVGVDVPNATVMLIENAERFGLAQLHQLRGRIGRGAHQSYCILVADAKNNEARQRLKALEETSDGFRIAEEDLRLRGPGEFLGQQQSGLPPFRFGDLTRDRELIERARELAKKVLATP